jgi:hypothetical protein
MDKRHTPRYASFSDHKPIVYKIIAFNFSSHCQTCVRVLILGCLLTWTRASTSSHSLTSSLPDNLTKVYIICEGKKTTEPLLLETF